MAVAMAVMVMSMKKFAQATGVIFVWLVDSHHRAFGYRQPIPLIKVRLIICLKQLALVGAETMARECFMGMNSRKNNQPSRFLSR
ncbi:hypothetical protein VAL12_006980 [Pseudomonas aeruginosa]|nr:hypothetical protein [Pseudomonas aeruginosa]EMB9912501.1 hypothetical protein [Pseudomonas aeruginosa]